MWGWGWAGPASIKSGRREEELFSNFHKDAQWAVDPCFPFPESSGLETEARPCKIQCGSDADLALHRLFPANLLRVAYVPCCEEAVATSLACHSARASLLSLQLHIQWGPSLPAGINL